MTCDGLKLSEAIRKGADLVPKLRNNWWTKGVDGNIDAACALGCVAVACSEVSAEPLRYDVILRDKWPELGDDVALVEEFGPFPDDDYDWGKVRPSTLQHFIVALNDGTDMGRHEIADLIEAMGY